MANTPITIEKDGSLSIDGFQQGIGNSTLSNFADMMGVNVTDNPGIASVGFKFNKIQETIPAQTFTVTTDRIVTSSPIAYRGAEDYIAVTVSTTGTLPTGLAVDTIYYLEKTATNTYKMKPQIKGTGYTSITAGTGSGTHTITPITPKHIVGWTRNYNGNIFALDTDRRVWFAGSDGVSYPWYLLDGNTSAGNAGGIVFYKGYILVFSGSKIDALTSMDSVSDDSIVWNNNIAGTTLSVGSANPFLSTNDDSIYFYNGTESGRYYKIGMFEEVPTKTFDPTDTTTFSVVTDATTIPFEYNGYITTIREINEYLIIGTGADKIYFWDKKSPSFTSFIRLQERNVQRIEVVDNIAYVFAGNNGSIYVANTASSNLLLRIPEQIASEYYGNFDITVNYSLLYRREILFSISFSPTSSTVENYLMAYNVDSKCLTKKNISSYGATTERNGLSYGRIYSMLPIGENILISSSSFDISDDKYTYAIESLLYNAVIGTGTPTYYCYANYESNIITGLITIGQVYAKKQFREVQVSFLRNLVANQGIKLYYRYDDNSAWTLLKTIDYTTYGGIKDIKEPAPIENVIDLQIKIELSGVNLTSPMLRYIRLIP